MIFSEIFYFKIKDFIQFLICIFFYWKPLFISNLVHDIEEVLQYGEMKGGSDQPPSSLPLFSSRDQQSLADPRQEEPAGTKEKVKQLITLNKICFIRLSCARKNYAGTLNRERRPVVVNVSGL